MADRAGQMGRRAGPCDSVRPGRWSPQPANDLSDALRAAPVGLYPPPAGGAATGPRMTGGGPRDAGAADALWSDWMAAAQSGDRLAYERLLRECAPLIRRVARRQGVQGDRVDDVVQEVLLTVHRARHTYDPARSFTAWLCTIAQRRAIDALRHRGRQDRREVHAPFAYENHPEEATGLERDLALDGQGPALQAAIDQLPPGQREAIQVLALRQLSLEEAAGATGKTKGALKVNMHRALNSLRARFGGPET